MELNPSGVSRTRIRLIWVNFSEILIKGNEFYFSFLCSFWISGSRVVYPILNLLLPSPFPFVTRQLNYFYFTFLSLELV